MSTICIVGARSAMAQEVATYLRDAGHTVVTAGRKECDIVCDVTKPFALPDKLDAVVNFAAAFGSDDDADVVMAVQTNVLGVLHTCMAARKAGAHMIQVSSMSAVLVADSPYYTAYAITKRQADELAAYYCKQHSVPLTILRPSQLYGTSPLLARHQPFFYIIIDKAAKGEDVTIYGRHDPKRNFLHIADFAELVKRTVERSVTGTYPCLYPDNTTYGDIARTAQNIFAKKGSIVFLDDKPNIPDNVFTMDLSIYEQTGYRAQVSLAAGIRRLQQAREGE
jgi:nucleoside-diphosphate-sugar epimerase